MPIHYPDPPGYVPDVMTKVYRALEDAGLEDREVLDAISEMQNEGVLFRERNDRLEGSDAQTILGIVFGFIKEAEYSTPLLEPNMGNTDDLLDALRRAGYCCCTTEFGCAACGGRKS